MHRTLKKYAIVLSIAIAYLIIVLAVGQGIPCFFHMITKLQCPACGVSRMLVALVRLDLAAAFGYNPYLLINGPIILGCLGYSEVRYIKSGTRKHPTWLNVILWGEIVLALIFGVWRNLPIV